MPTLLVPNYKRRGGLPYRLSLDVEAAEHMASKSDAQKLANTIRTQIDAGVFRRRRAAQGRGAHDGRRDHTARVRQHLFERRGKVPTTNDRGHLRKLCAAVIDDTPLGDRPLSLLTTDRLEAFFQQLQARGCAPSTRNKYRQFTLGLFAWAVEKGHMTRNPLDAAKKTIAHVSEKGSRRSRRLEPGEEGRLLAAAGPWLQRLIIGAIETGMRRGELLQLTWRDVDLARRELVVRAATSKTRTMRRLPISQRLAGVLAMCRHDPLGQPFGPEAFVFGDAIGRRVRTPKKAFAVATLKAHGYTPEWRRGGGELSAASLAIQQRIDLHLHDLRHEAGSRLLEAGWPIHHVQEMLGHSDAETNHQRS